MKAALVMKYGSLVVADVQKPDPAGGDVLVRVHDDRALVQGEGPLPEILGGHEHGDGEENENRCRLFHGRKAITGA